MKNIKNFVPFLLTIFSISYYWNILNAPFRHDTYKLLCASNGPLANTWQYWLHILTNLTHAGIQYRPLSYFFYFIFLRTFFGLNPLYHHIMGLILFITATLSIWNLLVKLKSSTWALVTSMMFFILYPGHYHLLDDISSNLKYYLPLILLSSSLSLSITRKSLSKRRLAIIFLMLTFSIMSHEGSISFAILVLITRWYYFKLNRSEFFILIAPSLFYLIARIFIFHIPSSGFMSIDFSNTFQSTGKYLYFLFGNTPFSLTLLLILCYASTHLAIKDKLFLPLIYLLFTLTLLFPFAILHKHFFYDRSVFATIPATLLISDVLTRFKKYRPFIITVLFIVLVTTHIKANKNVAAHSDYSRHKRIEQELYSFIKEKSHAINNNSIIHIKLSEMKTRHDIVGTSTLPGMLALNLPEKRFFLQESFFGKELFIYIQNGFPYYSTDKINWTDIYNYSYQFTIDAPAKTIILDIESIYVMNYYII